MGNKRRRLALSCVTCRRRKVKCGREEPKCVRCEKGGTECLYVPYEEDLEGTPLEKRRTSWSEDAEGWNDAATKVAEVQRSRASGELPQKRSTGEHAEIDRLERKIADLEARTRVTEARPAAAHPPMLPGYPTPSSIAIPEAGKNPIYDLEQMLLRGKSFKTQYFGPTHPASILTQFGDLSKFVKNVMDHFPVVEQIKESMDRLKKNKSETIKEGTAYDHASLLALVPDKQTADKLVQEYVDYFESTYRVLHVPSFMRQYESFWQAPNQALTEFLVVLLLVLATVYCVSTGDDKFNGRSSVRRETAAKMIDSCDAWLNVQSQKHVTLITYQVNVLLFLARRMNCIKIKREWAGAGHLLRIAQAAGFHREPTLLSTKISVFDQEMRRRLWATILELELQMSIDRGMPSAVSADGWDCRAPSNIDDEDFDIPSNELPPQKSLIKYTRSSFLALAQQSAPLRIELLARANSIRSNLQLEEVLVYDAKLRQMLDDLPDWNVGTAITKAQLARTLTRLQLLEFLIIVHQPFATQTLSQTRYFYSRASTRDAASSILNSYHTLPEPTNLALCLFRDDQLRAALSICHDLGTSNSLAPSITYTTTTPQALTLIEATINLLGERVMHLGQGFHSFWILSSALSLVFSKMNPDTPMDTFAQQAAERVVKIHDRIVMLQEREGLPSVGDKLLAKAQGEMSGSQVGVEIDPGMAAVDPFNQSNFGLENFDLGQIWNLDSFFDF
jgi:Fungal specific transcription factor domain/Fungal Zn(2)-Cys(6) binuclear cluster domain